MQIQQFIRVAKAVSDPGRVKILKLLESRDLCVCEIRELVGLAQPTVSKHLKILEEAGLVESAKIGQWVNYRLAGEAASEPAKAMLGYLRQSLDDDPELITLRGRLPFVDRETLCGGR